jgi:hypothetical protein
MTHRLSAWFAEVPLEVLPGHESEFRSLVIFGRGEDGVAGVRCVAVVGVRVEGLPIGEGDGDDEGTGHGVAGR